MKTTPKHLFAVFATTAIAFLAVAPASRAAIITWNTVGQITGDADVSTNGTLVNAFNVGDTFVPSTTVNGVLFTGFAVPTGSNAALNPAPPASIGNYFLSALPPSDVFLSDNSLFGSVAPPSLPFTGLSAAYQTLLQSATVTAQPTEIKLQMFNLTIGQTYEFQWWANYSGTSLQPSGVNTSTLHSATTQGGSAVVLDDNTTKIAGIAQEGGLGQFAIGSFLADSTNQTIFFSPVPATGPNSFAQLNAFQLRSVAAVSVPETATLLAGCLPFSVLLLGAFVRRGATAAGKI